jgi:twinkle protein
MTLWTSGTGSGKSTIIRELVNQHLIEGRTVGMVMLEESPSETVDDILSLRINKQIRRITAQRELNKLKVQQGRRVLDSPDDLTDEEYATARRELEEQALFVYDSHGINDHEALFSRLEFMATALNCDVIILDHITAAVAGMGTDDSSMNSERLVIDDLMKRLRSLVERSGVHLDIISQLRKSSTGRGYEEGERITLSDLRGSGSLASVPNTVIAMERNRQDPDLHTSNTSILRILKNRFSGNTGMMAAVRYNPLTGRLHEVEYAINNEGKTIFGDLK